MNPPRKTLYLIDGSSYIYRAFYAIQDLSTSKGMPTNAVYGFVGMLNRILKEKRPTYMAVALDPIGPTFRHELSKDYKANRQKMPEALAEQIPVIKRLIDAYGIPCLEAPGYEADDIIGTLSSWASEQGAEAVIISGDKDLLQLVKPAVRVWDTMKDEVIGSAEVEERFGVPPSQLVEVMALAGDSSDNIPGVPGFGPKTAQRLIKAFGTVENLLSDPAQIPRDKERKKLETYAEQALLSWQLARIRCDVPLSRDWGEFRLGGEDREALIGLFRELEFRRFLQELENGKATVEHATIRRDYDLVDSPDALQAILPRILASGRVAIHVEIAGRHALESTLVGLSLAWEPEQACYIPFRRVSEVDTEQLNSFRILELLFPMLTDPGFAKVTHCGKLAWLALKKLGIDLAGMEFDTMLGAYVLDPAKRVERLEVLVKEHLNESMLSCDDLLGTGRKRLSFASVSVDQASAYAGDQAVFCLRLADVLDEKISGANQVSLFRDIELPLVGVLARMEMTGVRVDRERLVELGKDLDERVEVSGQKIYSLAGEPFNINSPQQLGQIIFEKLGLPLGKRTKTGYSTAMEVLSALARYHPLPGEVINYRSLMKLKNTYVDVLPRMINPESGRIHTSYNQTATVTGRLSSSEPNLQNIPVRTEDGREIRRAFVADPGSKLVSADYSQIELRILAHYSEDGALIDAFRQGKDIHSLTAAEVFGVNQAEVTEEMRRQAKTVNFGIIYGMSPFGLSKDLGIPQGLARQIIERYFRRYDGVRSYVEKTPEVARQRGFVTTLFQRKRYLPDLHSRNRNVREFAERTAINTPIQGSAADIIKMAMIRLDSAIAKKGLPARMIMQVHDELVFEVESSAVEEVAALVQVQMESVASFAVPLEVQVGIGDNWDEAH